MKKFKFRLEKVLDHRELLKETAKGELLECNQRVLECEEAINDRQRTIMESREEVVLLSREGHQQVSKMVEIETYITGAKVQIARLKMRLRELKTEQEQKQEKLIQANRDLRALEVLQEKNKNEYKIKQTHEEQKKSDDLVLMRYKKTSL